MMGPAFPVNGDQIVVASDHQPASQEIWEIADATTIQVGIFDVWRKLRNFRLFDNLGRSRLHDFSC